MHHISQGMVALLALVLAGCAGDAWGAESPASDRARTLVVGRVSENLKSAFPKVEGFAAYLTDQLRGQGIDRFEVVVAHDNAEMIRLLRQGAVDMVSETPMSAFLYREEAGAEILLREWKKGVASYHTVFFTRKGSGIRSLADLAGKVVAFEDPGSTTGFVLPLAVLRAAGLDPMALEEGVRPPPGMVGYRFARSEISIAVWVERGLADAGAFSNLDWDNLERSPPVIRDTLAILHESAPVVRSLLLVRGGLEPSVRLAITRILTTMDQDAAGREVLKRYYGVSKYDAIEGDAAAMLRAAEEAFRRLRDEIPP